MKNIYRLKKTLLLLIVVLIIQSAKSQTIPTAQDCMGAIPVCKEKYSEPSPYKYVGEGNYTHEIYKPATDTCITEEIWGVWYVFTAQSSGMLRFSITPKKPDVDYDWIVFDFTKYSCPNFGVEGTPYLSSNNYGSYTDPYNGITGANSSKSNNNGNCDGPGDEIGRIPWNDDIPLTIGRTYLLYVSNWSQALDGYELDFSGSTAKIFDDKPPEMNLVNSDNQLSCGENSFFVSFTENVRCDSISVDKFILTNGTQNFPIKGIFNPYCSVGVDSTKVRNFEFFTEDKLQAGIYSLIFTGFLTDACGNFTDGDTLQFEVRSLQFISENHTEISCFGKSDAAISISASDKNPEIFYSIDGGNSFQLGASSYTFSNLSSGNYPIVIKNKFGCLKEVKTILIAEPPELKLVDIQTNDVTSCYGNNDGSILINVAGGTNPLQYSINGGTSYSTNNGIFKNLPQGQYTIKIRDKNNCSIDGYSTEIQQPNELKISISTTSGLKCFNDLSGSITATASGGTGALQYKTQNSEYQSNGEFFYLDGGTYILTVKDENNCTKQAESVTLSEPNELKTNNLSTQNVTCNGFANGSISFEVVGGTPHYVTNTVNSSNSSISNLNALSADRYKINISDANNCNYILTVDIIEPETITATENTKHVTCNGGYDGGISLLVEGGTKPYSYLWSNNETTKDLADISAGMYRIELSDANQCVYEKTITVNQPTQFSVRLQKAHIDCFGNKNGSIEASVFGSAGNIFYTWSNGAETKQISNLDTGIYEVIVTDRNTMVCAYASDTITQPDSLKIIVTDLKLSCNGTATGYIAYKLEGGTLPYSFASSIPENTIADSILHLYPDNYILKVTDANNCYTELQQFVDEQPCEIDLRIPNIFTPNDDETNDVFKVSGINLEFADFEAQIFNRWGQKLLTSTNPSVIWNGKLDNREAVEGVYYYVINAKALHGGTLHKKGFFVLKR